jgi:hypothetical protein
MRYFVIGAALAVVSSAALAQDSVWGTFEGAEGTTGAGVQAANGAQLLFKCDKPGKGEVYGIVVTAEPLVPPNNTRFQMRPTELRFDDGAPLEDRWRFYESSASAVNQRTENQVVRLVNGIADANTFRIRMNPERARWVEATFQVTGAREAIGQVYTSCQDDNPLG